MDPSNDTIMGMEELGDLLETPMSDALVLSEREKAILVLWDQEDELRLEQSLIHSEISCTSEGCI